MKLLLRPLLATLPAVFLGLLLPLMVLPTTFGPDPYWMELPESQASGWGPCEDLRVIVNLKWNTVGDVETHVKGNSVTQDELIQKLLVFAERKRDTENPLQPSEVRAHLRVEPDIPWSEVRRVLDACEDPDVRIYKITFAVRPPRR